MMTITMMRIEEVDTTTQVVFVDLIDLIEDLDIMILYS
jgi:hypothetical protein